jgi:Zn-dependent membrane protease YugP
VYASYWGIVLIALVLGLVTQALVNGAFRSQSAVPLAGRLSGAEVARAMLDAEGLQSVRIERVSGTLTDHYDPRGRVLRLSPQVYEGRSVASAGVASHEAGHAVQHARGFAFARVRQSLVPAAQIGSQFAFPMIFIGVWIRLSGLILLGVIMYSAAVLFQLVTLPVEFDASRRALAALQAGHAGVTLPAEQVAGARKVLAAAAMTYLAATLIAVMYLLYFLGLSRR